MAGDIFRKPSSGEPFIPSARQQGAFIDAARAVESLSRRLAAVEREIPRVLVHVKNQTGSDCPRFGVLTINDVVIPPAISESEFLNNYVFKTSSGPDDVPSQRIVIAQEPIPDGEIGRAMISGVSPCKLVIVEAQTYDRAEIIAGDNSKMTAADTGPVAVVWNPAEEGEHFGIVKLDEGPGEGHYGNTFELKDDLYECAAKKLIKDPPSNFTGIETYSRAWLVDPATQERMVIFGDERDLFRLRPEQVAWRGVAFGTQGDDEANRGDIVVAVPLNNWEQNTEGEGLGAIVKRPKTDFSQTVIGSGHFNVKGTARPAGERLLVTVCLAPNWECFCQSKHDDDTGFWSPGEDCSGCEGARTIKFEAEPPNDDADEFGEDEPVIVHWCGNRWVASRVFPGAGCGLQIETDSEDEDFGKVVIDPDIAGCGLEFEEEDETGNKVCQLHVDPADLAGCGLKETDGEDICSLDVDNVQLAGSHIEPEGDCALQVDPALIKRIEDLEKCCLENRECCDTLSDIIIILIECCEESRDCCYENSQCCYENRECCDYVNEYCCDGGGVPGADDCTGVCLWQWDGTDWDLLVPCAGPADCDCAKPTQAGTQPGDQIQTDCTDAPGGQSGPCCACPANVNVQLEAPCLEIAETKTNACNGDGDVDVTTFESPVTCLTASGGNPEVTIDVYCADDKMLCDWSVTDQNGCDHSGTVEADSVNCSPFAVEFTFTVPTGCCCAAGSPTATVTISPV